MEADEKACPYCAETVKAAAVRCKHCKADLAQPAGDVQRASPGVSVVLQQSPGPSGAQVFGQFLLWPGLIACFYGLYRKWGISEARAALGEYGSAEVFSRLDALANALLFGGGITCVVALFLIVGGSPGSGQQRGEMKWWYWLVGLALMAIPIAFVLTRSP